MENSKPFWQSKTVWVAILTFLTGGFMAISSQYPSLGWAVMGKAILDILLRILTEQPISSGKNKDISNFL